MKKIMFLFALLLLIGCSESLQNNMITGNVVALDEVSTERFIVRFEDGNIFPDEITVKEDNMVIIEFYDKNSSTDLFFIDGYDVEMPVIEGKSNVYFKANKKGVFDFGLRKELNKGKLIVE